MGDNSASSWLAKIQRAKETIDNLEAEIDRWGSSNPKPYRIESKLDLERRAYVFTAFGGPIPVRFAVLTGEVIYHLRSSLDHVVWALAQKRVRNPGTKIHFPICDTADKFEKACVRGELKGIAESARTIIRSVQPFHKKQPRLEPLAVLNRFSNIDKHRLLLIVSNTVVLGDSIRIDGGDANTEIIGMSPPPELERKVATEQGTEVFSIQFGAKFSPKARVWADFTIVITLDEFRPEKSESVIGSLRLLLGAVENTIMLFDRDLRP